MVQWLEFLALTVEGLGSVPGQGTKIPGGYLAWPKKKKEKKTILHMPKTQLIVFYNLIHIPQVAGGRNLPVAVEKVSKASIDQSREMKYQSFNEYRKRFLLKPYESFEELTGEKQFLNFFEESRGKWKQRS